MNPKIYTSKDHHIRNDHIDPNALYILKRLHEEGFIAYLVGGSVRDLLLHKKPKDFDISTNAEPQELKEIFKRQCLLIGRRFPLAHIRFGKQYIEVSTFRAGDPKEGELIMQDSNWGTPEEDVLRRDFTINGLFYDPLDHRIIDYVQGFEDIQKQLIRSIGDPMIRFRQDPVRMIRLQKFQARFGFDVQYEDLMAIKTLRTEITKSSPARVLEEIFRMLESGSSEPFFRILYASKFLHTLFPKLSMTLDEEGLAYLKAADALNVRGYYQPLFRELLAATLIYPIVEKVVKKEIAAEKKITIGTIIQITQAIIFEIFGEAFPHFPKRLKQGALYICQMQYRLTPLDKKRPSLKKQMKQKDFVMPLTFLKLRSLLDPELVRVYDYWKKLWKEAQEESA